MSNFLSVICWENYSPDSSMNFLKKFLQCILITFFPFPQLLQDAHLFPTCPTPYSFFLCLKIKIENQNKFQ